MRVSLRTIILSIAGLLTALSVAALGYLTWSAYQQQLRSQDMLVASQTSQLLRQSVSNWAVERGVTHTALNASEQHTVDFRAVIAERRQSADAALGKALAIIDKRQFEDKAENLAAVRRAYEDVVQLRRRADVDLGRKFDRRDGKVRDIWFDAISHLIAVTHRLHLVAAIKGGDVYALASQLSRLTHHLWVMSEHAGQERALLGGVISAQSPLIGEPLHRLRRFRGRLEGAWTTVQSEFRRLDLDARVVAAEALMKAEFLDRFEQTRKAIYRAGLAAAPYPMAGGEWISRATAAIDTIVDLESEVDRAVAGLAAEIGSQAQTRMVWMIVVVILVCAIYGVAIMVVSNRVVGPLRRVTEAMSALARGELDVVVREEAGIEVGAMVEALKVFKDNTAARHRAELALRQNQAMLSRAQGLAGLGSWNWDLSTEIVNWSDELFTILGLDPRQAKASHEALMQAVHPDDRALVSVTIGRAIEEKRDGAVEHRILRPDGVERFVRSQVDVSLDQDGAATIMVGIVHDITEQKVTEEALRSQRDFADGLVETAPVMVGVLDIEGRIVRANRRFEELTGCSQDEIRGQGFVEALAAEGDRRLAERQIDNVLHGREAGSCSLEIRASDGSRRITDWHFDALRDNEGAISGLLIAGLDVTSQRGADQQLRNLSRAVEQSPVSVIITDTEGTIEYVNPKFTEVSGFSAQEAIGANPRMLKSGHTSHDEYRELWRTIKRGEEWRGVFRNRRKGGETYWEQASISPVKNDDGTITHFLAVKEDISSRIEAESAVRETAAHLQTILDNIADGVVTIDRGGLIRSANPAVERIFGYRQDELLGRGLGVLMRQGDWAKHEHAVIRFMQEGNSNFFGKVIEVTTARKDGREISLELVVSRMAGARTEFIGAFRDVSERKAAENDREALGDQLRQSQKMEAVGTLAGGIAHDFNNILAAIIGFAYSALEEIPAQQPAHEDLVQIIKASDRATDLIRHILAFSRQGERGREALELHLVAEDAMTMVRASLPSSVKIVQNIDPDAGLALIDPTQWQQVLLNLCVNSSQAMKDVRGQLEVSLARRQIGPAEVERDPSLGVGDYLELIVSDDGKGMDEETLSRIFEPFFTTKPVGQGTGMGLAAVHGIVLGHGGSISVHSVPGEGTAMRILLPAVDRPGEPKGAPEAAVDGSGSERILFVDDEPAICKSVEKALLRFGYKPTIFTSSRDALDAFRQAPLDFDLVITDQTMPELTGDALIRDIVEIREDIPIIICSGYSESMSTEAALKVGAKGFLPKPIPPRLLGEKIRGLLDGPRGLGMT